MLLSLSFAFFCHTAALVAEHEAMLRVKSTTFRVVDKLADLAEDGFDVGVFTQHKTVEQYVTEVNTTFRILGLYNTGTNYLSDLLEANFQTKAWEGTNEDLRKGYPVHGTQPNTSLYNCELWKHSFLSRIAEKTDVMDSCDDPNIVVVAITRNPLAWVNSFARSAYDLHHCTPEEVDASSEEPWYSRPCHYETRAEMTVPSEELWYSRLWYPITRNPLVEVGPSVGPKSLMQGFAFDNVDEVWLAAKTRWSMQGLAFDNVEEMWSQWMKEVETMADFGIQKGIVVKFEDLVLDTAGTLARIADVAGLSFSAENLQQHAGAANPSRSGTADAHAEQVDKILSREYLGELGDQVQGMCALLNRTVVSQHGYEFDCVELAGW